MRPRPDADIPAPVRFLPEYDNVLLSHKDRSRFGPGVLGAFAQTRRPFKGTILVDGEGRAIWHSELNRDSGSVTLSAGHLPLTRSERRDVEAELRARQERSGTRTRRPSTCGWMPSTTPGEPVGATLWGPPCHPVA